MHDDRDVRIIHHVIVFCSTTLSGYFGWVMGEGAFPLNVILALWCGMAPLAVAAIFKRAAIAKENGYLFAAYRAWFFGSFFLIANVFFDYSSATVLRDQVSVYATNVNTKADDVREQVKRTRDGIAKLKAEKAWEAPLLSPDAYTAEITNLKGHMIYKRSKGCADQTLSDTFAHCQKIAEAEANKANAERRLVIAQELKQREVELKDLEGKSGETQHTSNPALAQVRSIGAWFTGSRSLNEAQSFWTANGLMLLMSLLLNGGIAYFADIIGTGRAKLRPEPDPVPEMQHMAGRNILTDQRPPEVRAADPPPIPLRPVPGNTSVTFITDPTKTGLTPQQFDNLMALAQDALNKAKNRAAG